MPTPEQWEALSQRAQETGAILLIWGAEPPTGAFDKAAGLGLRNVVLPPLATRPDSGDFVGSMAAALRALEDAAG